MNYLYRQGTSYGISKFNSIRIVAFELFPHSDDLNIFNFISYLGFYYFEMNSSQIWDSGHFYNSRTILSSKRFILKKKFVAKARAQTMCQ